MGYVERVLQPGETVIQVTRIHWWFLWRRPVALLILAGIAFYAGLHSGDPTLYEIGEVGAGILFVLAVLTAIRGAINRWTTELAVTDRRVIMKSGFVRRHTFEMNLSQVEGVSVDQGILGRMLNFGTVQVHGSGTDSESFSYIADPLRFRSSIVAR